MKMKKKKLFIAIILLASFVLWTALISLLDVKPIGPNATSVGFATLNRFFHELTGVNLQLYIITDWLGLIPIAAAFGFAILGVIQLIKRKSLWKVDFNILALGTFYIVVIIAYLFFEIFIINYRPTLINGYLEASYPSSTTMLVMSVMPTMAMQLNVRIKNIIARRCVIIAIMAFIAFMIIARLLSGVHWITDIIGGALLSAGLVILYDAIGKVK
jgi:undecaprenyl-diphosphatase